MVTVYFIQMSSDFIVVGIDSENNPILDDTSPERLESEWNAIKMDLRDPKFAIESNFYTNFLHIIEEVAKRDEESIKTFLQKFASDINSLLQDKSCNLRKSLIFAFFVDIMEQLHYSFFDISDKSIVLSILNLLFLSYNDITPHIFITFVEVLKADEIIDENNFPPFYIFLIKSYPNDDKIGEISRDFLLNILKKNPPTINLLIPSLFQSFIYLFCFFSDIAPTIFDTSHPINLCKFINQIFNICEELNFEFYQNFLNTYCINLSQTLFPNIETLSSITQFKAMYFFLSQIHHIPTLSVIINYIIQKDSVFSRNIDSWLENWTSETLKLLSAMLDLRSYAIQTAFFYLENIDQNASLFSFPEKFPPKSLPKWEKKSNSYIKSTYAKYKIVNEKLPMPSDHVISLFTLISDLFQSYWELSIETDELLIAVIEKIAACGNEYSNAFCFIHGKGIYSLTQMIVMKMTNADKDHKVLLSSFIGTMHGIFQSLNI